MTPIEILTLVPLGALIVVFGIQPGLLLDLVAGQRRRRRSSRPRPARRSPIAAEPRARSARSASSSWRSSRGSAWALVNGPVARHGRRGRRRRDGALSSQDLATIAPLIAAVLTAAAVLVVDLIRPGRSDAGRRDGAHRPRADGGHDAAGRRARPATAFGGSYTVDALTTFLDILFIAVIVADDPVRARLPAAARACRSPSSRSS